MISNDEVRQYFRKVLELPDVVNGLMKQHARAQHVSYRVDNRVQLQIHRGQAARFWEGVPDGGCARCKALFNEFDVIPKFCFDCYKVVIEPRTVVELFKLLIIFEGVELSRDNSRKCNVAKGRPGPVRYQGFIYCRGLEEAQEICQVMRKVVDGDIAPEVPVRVKRGCSEFSEKYPEYGQIDNGRFEYGKDWKFYEDFVDTLWIFGEHADMFDEDGQGVDPMREIVAYQYWLRYAASIGDTSYLELTDGRTLEPLTSSS